MSPLIVAPALANLGPEGLRVPVQTRLDGLLPVLLVGQVIEAVGTVAVVTKLSISKAVTISGWETQKSSMREKW